VGISAFQLFSFSAFAPAGFSLSAFGLSCVSAFGLVISAFQCFSVSAFGLWGSRRATTGSPRRVSLVNYELKAPLDRAHLTGTQFPYLHSLLLRIIVSP
jgi:uncharacterized iron-regulated membrane protein